MKTKPIYTRTGKRQFITSLLDGIRDDLIRAVPRMPEDWDHADLRALISTRVVNQLGSAAQNQVPREDTPKGATPRALLRRFMRAVVALGAVLVLVLAAPGCGDDAQVTPDPEAAPLCERYGHQWSGVAQACGVPEADALNAADLELQRVTAGRGCGAVRYVPPDQVGACAAALEALIPSCDAAGFDAQARALPECVGIAWELLP